MKSYHIPVPLVILVLFALAAFGAILPVKHRSCIRSGQHTGQCPGGSTFRTLPAPDDMSSVLSMDDELSAVSEVLSEPFLPELNQHYSSYRHELPGGFRHVSYYDDAENHKMLFTVYSDGVCIVNSAFVKVKYPGGGAAQLYQQLAEIVK